jgi:hypothetical protein
MKKLLTIGLILFTAGLAHAWIATVAAPPVINSGEQTASVTVNFSSTTAQGTAQRQVTFTNVSSKEDLRARCKDTIRQYILMDTDIPTTNFSVDLSTASPFILTQVEIDRNNWIQDYYDYLRVTSLFTVGLATTTDTALVNKRNTLKTKVHDNFIMEYLQYVIP